MRSLQSIIHESREQGIKSASENKHPFVIEQEDISNRQILSDTIRRIPDIGSYVPNGWIQLEQFFVDNTGWSNDSELALHNCISFDAFLDKVKLGKAYAIVEVGQFQVYVGEFERKKEKTYAGPLPCNDCGQIHFNTRCPR